MKIIPGNSKTLWNAVRIAKEVEVVNLPQDMSVNDSIIKTSDLPQAFADFFEYKVKNILDTTEVNPTVYNGKQAPISQNNFFMTESDIKECVRSIKVKNSEGFDRITQRVLVDGENQLLKTLMNFFYRIYQEKCVPEQWLVSKIIPIHKKVINAKLKIIAQLQIYVALQNFLKN